MTSGRLPYDHWVSRGYQNNFASTDKRVAILDVATRRICDRARPTKSNFGEPGFTTYLIGDSPVDHLEKGFASVEQSVLNQVRAVSATNRDPVLAGAVANLFAIHLVRSPSFRDFHAEVLHGFRQNGATELAADPRLPAVFEQHIGRPPAEGELLDTAQAQLDRFLEDPSLLAEAMARQHDKIAEKLSRFDLQVIEIAQGLPGLVLADTPVVHAHLDSGRYGFRDRLALLDASLIIGPVTRSVAACFSATRLSPATIRTHKALDALNALFIRAAAREVACHPDDARRLQQVAAGLDRLPPRHFLDLRRS